MDNKLSETKLGPTGRPLPDIPEIVISRPVQGKGSDAKVVALCNQKGGVGKTTTTMNLGACLAERGARVLVVDLDPQGALSVGLGVNPLDLDLTVYNLLMGDEIDITEVIRPTVQENLHLLPANIDLAAAEVQLINEVAREHALVGALEPVFEFYDYILIDCQPSLGLLTINALTAADGVVMPLECEYFALRGVALLLDTINKVKKRLNRKLEIAGVVATMHDGRTLHAKEVMASLLQEFSDNVFHTTIPRTVKFPETTVAGEPITTYDPSGSGATAYRMLARELHAKMREL